MKEPQIIASVGLDRELSDLLDFSMMFLLPVASRKGWPVSLASAQFRGAVALCTVVKTLLMMPVCACIRVPGFKSLLHF
uniref:Uncharacterized protein n=1 Tax=Oryctolagus cuniculus TaxID=9986 RepID=A0A5F9CPB3_RABIT